MKHKSNFAVFILLCWSAALCSCVISVSQDPLLKANASKIQDTEYPQDYIVGLWVEMKEAECMGIESKLKVYYDIRSGGKGTMRQSQRITQWEAPSKSISLEGEFKWRYLGLNRWEIILPPSSAYRVTDASGYKIGYCESRSFIVRYYDGCLYELPHSSRDKHGAAKHLGSIFVKATQQNIQEASNMARRNANVVIKP